MLRLLVLEVQSPELKAAAHMLASLLGLRHFHIHITLCLAMEIRNIQ
jgi:hypothetical protein